MRRRDFLTTAGAMIISPFAAMAQARPAPRGPGGRPWVIGLLISQTKEQSDIDSLGPFLKGMAALGYVEGSDFKVEARYADGDLSRIPGLAATLVGLKPDLILANEAAARGAPSRIVDRKTDLEP